ncbi:MULTISPECIES: IcmT/TraK family protein [unclassified Burkholderia]|uniref:IcmT/TraK family protein n=1 Tax=unclassified Burkholderia TaxID=2613784 RepID=UPI002AB167DD|nr:MULTISPECIES: IcmT/TraK family protein [unclassified Burkholderia]
MSWAAAAGTTKLGPFPAYLVFGPLLLFLTHIRWWTFVVMLIAIATLWFLHGRGKTLMWMIRRYLSKLRGHRLEARPLYFRNRLRIRISADDLSY